MQGAIQQPLVQFKTTNEVAAGIEARKAEAAPPPRYVQQLASYIEQCWSDAKRAKTEVEDRMLKNQRMRAGIYEAEKLDAIRSLGGSEVYVLLTATKCRALEAWVTEAVRAAGDSVGDVEPTPIVDIPPDIADQIKQEGMAVFQEVMRQFQAIGANVSMAEVADEVREYLGSQKDSVLKELNEEAKRRAERMNRKIDDIMAETQWAEVLKAAVSDMITMKAGIVKGPVVRHKKRTKWVQNPDGSWGIGAEYEFVPVFERVSPLDIYPAPDSRHPDDGYIIERIKYTRSDLTQLLGVPGYSDENIRKVLKDYRSGRTETLSIDTERSEIEFSGNSEHLTNTEKIDGIEFWGSVPGSMLIEWGMEGDLDPEMEYEITAIKFGNHVIRAIMNPDKMGQKPYSVDSFERIPGSFWGRGLPELMSDIQDVCNAIARAIVNNASFASGPLVEVNMDRMEGDVTTLHPWKIYQSNNQMMSEQKAVNFYQPNIVVGPLLQAFEFFSTQAEDQTGVPRWAHGNANLGGAGSTSSGLSMLMSSASRGVQEFISHFDVIIKSCLTRLYNYLMVHDPDESIKGDCRIIAKGTQALIAKEQSVIRLRETLAMTNNPTDMQIMGLEGRAKLLGATFKSLDLPEGVVPVGDDLKAMIAKIEQQQAMMMQQAIQNGQPMQGPQGAVPPEAAQALDPAGNPAGGTDMSMQAMPGMTPGA